MTMTSSYTKLTKLSVDYRICCLLLNAKIGKIRKKRRVRCRTFFVRTYQPLPLPAQTLRPDTNMTRHPCLKANLPVS